MVVVVVVASNSWRGVVFTPDRLDEKLKEEEAAENPAGGVDLTVVVVVVCLKMHA